MNKQVKRSMNWITEALVELMDIKPYDLITISDITTEADVARPTFYRNFDSKEDILFYKRQEIYDKAMSRIAGKGIADPYKATELLIEVFRESSSFFNTLIDNNLDYLITKDFNKEISRLIMEAFNIDVTEPYKVKFLEGAFLAVILEWMKQGMKETAKEISRYIGKYMGEVM